MKVKFIKDYPPKFKKGQIAKLHWTFAGELLKKKIIKQTNEETLEDIELNKLKDGDNG